MSAVRDARLPAARHACALEGIIGVSVKVLEKNIECARLGNTARVQSSGFKVRRELPGGPS
jgi:hypothetical protein